MSRVTKEIIEFEYRTPFHHCNPRESTWYSAQTDERRKNTARTAALHLSTSYEPASMETTMKFVAGIWILSILWSVVTSQTLNSSSGWNAMSLNSSSSPTTICTLPKLIGSWQRGTKYPLKVGEAQGAMIGSSFLLVSGFNNAFDFVTNYTYALDTHNPQASWNQQDSLPLRVGITHAAFVVVNQTKFYMCGGYVGGHPGTHTNRCFILDLTKPRRQQWSTMASLPNGGRGGGGMVYDTRLDALIFTGGAQRPYFFKKITIDYNNTWMYSFRNPAAGWVAKAPIPYKANHLSWVTSRDATGQQRHFFVGGQDGDNEPNGNKIDHFEYDALYGVWIRRKSMNIPRGHASSSTRAWGCGYIVAGGATNGGSHTADISYYHIPTDS